MGIALGLGLLPAVMILSGCSGSGSGTAFGRQDDPTVTIDMVQKNRSLAPDEPYWPYRLARWNLGAGDAYSARAYLDTALVLDPDYAPAAALLSKVQYDSGQYEQAAFLLREFLDRNPGAPDALRVALALNLQALEDPEQSEVILAGCRDQSGPVQTARTYAHLQGEDFQVSLQLARAALEDNPDSAPNHNNLGISLLYAGKPVEARQAFNRSLEIDPELPGALYNLAIVENFYFFDLESSRESFLRYRAATRNRPLMDPDNLGMMLGISTSTAGNTALDSQQASLFPTSQGGGHE